MNLFYLSGILIAIVVAQQLADIWSTWQVLRLGGRERNHLMLWLMDRLGVLPALLTTKTLLLAALAWAISEEKAGTAELVAVLFAVVLIYAYILLGNMRALREQRVIAAARK